MPAIRDGAPTSSVAGVLTAQRCSRTTGSSVRSHLKLSPADLADLDSDAFVRQARLSLDDWRTRWGMTERVDVLWSADWKAEQASVGFGIFRRSSTTVAILDEIIGCAGESACAAAVADPVDEQAVVNAFVLPKHRDAGAIVLSPGEETGPSQETWCVALAVRSF